MALRVPLKRELVETLEETLISKEVKIDDCKFLIAIKKK